MFHFDNNAYPSSGPANPAGQAIDAPPPSNMGITDEELLESLVMHDAPSPAGAHMAYGQHHHHPGAVALAGPPFRSLQPHLGGASPMAFHSPVSPADMYSPASGSTSNPDSFFWDREGSLSTGDEILAGQGRGSSGDVSDQGERAGGAAKPNTGFRQSTARRGHMASTHSPYGFVGAQDRPQAFSVPTYLASPSARDAGDAWGRHSSKDAGALRLSGVPHGQTRPRAAQTFGALGSDLAATDDAKANMAPSSAPAFGSSRMTDPPGATKGADEPDKQSASRCAASSRS